MSVSRARKVLQNESEAIKALVPRIDGAFEDIITLLSSTSGRVIVTGMGKPGFIAQKVSATLSSTGTPSLYLHPAEASHGDLGRVTREDVIIAFSNSGETEEVIKLLPIVKKIGAKIVAVTGRKDSTLALNSDYVIDSAVEKEACPMGLAPTTSTTVMLALGDALAIALLEKKEIKPSDFALYHPGGALGKRLLLTVRDIMRPREMTPIVGEEERLKDVLLKVTRLKAGSASVVNAEGKLVGIFTDGDLRRHFEEGGNILEARVGELMTRSPASITPERMAAEAFEILRHKKIDELPVIDEKGSPAGIIDVQDILRAGLV